MPLKGNLAHIYAAGETEWSPADLSILEEGRRKPPELPSAMFGSAWPELVKLAADKGAPTDYVALSWLAVSTALIGSKRRCLPYPGSSWEEPAILWLGLVGDPSHNKSPALDPFANILRRLEDEKADDHVDALNTWHADVERAKVEKVAWQDMVKAASKDGLPTPPLPEQAIEPDQPRRRRHFVQDATPESIGEILEGNPQGVLMVRDELAGWFSGFDRYNPGGRSQWLESFGGRQFTVDRKGAAKPLRIPYNGVNVIGGIQPGKLADCLLRVTDDGLAARFLFAWPNRPPFSRPTSSANIAGVENALRRLDALDWTTRDDGKRGAVLVPLDADAADVFDSCCRLYGDQEQDAGGLLKSFIGKLRGLTLRLALASELARWSWSGGPEPQSISRGTLEAVADFVVDYAIPMAERVYGDAALPPVERNAATLARHIRRHKLRTINTRNLQRKDRLPGLSEAADIDPAIEALMEAGWLQADPQRKGATTGRQSRDYSVNPAIWRA